MPNGFESLPASIQLLPFDKFIINKHVISILQSVNTRAPLPKQIEITKLSIDTQRYLRQCSQDEKVNYVQINSEESKVAKILLDKIIASYNRFEYRGLSNILMPKLVPLVDNYPHIMISIKHHLDNPTLNNLPDLKRVIKESISRITRETDCIDRIRTRREYITDPTRQPPSQQYQSYPGQPHHTPNIPRIINPPPVNPTPRTTEAPRSINTPRPPQQPRITYPPTVPLTGHIHPSLPVHPSNPQPPHSSQSLRLPLQERYSRQYNQSIPSQSRELPSVSIKENCTFLDYKTVREQSLPPSYRSLVTSITGFKDSLSRIRNTEVILDHNLESMIDTNLDKTSFTVTDRDTHRQKTNPSRFTKACIGIFYLHPVYTRDININQVIINKIMDLILNTILNLNTDIDIQLSDSISHSSESTHKLIEFNIISNKKHMKYLRIFTSEVSKEENEPYESDLSDNIELKLMLVNHHSSPEKRENNLRIIIQGPRIKILESVKILEDSAKISFSRTQAPKLG